MNYRFDWSLQCAGVKRRYAYLRLTSVLAVGMGDRIQKKSNYSQFCRLHRSDTNPKNGDGLQFTIQNVLTGLSELLIFSTKSTKCPFPNGKQSSLLIQN